MSCQHPDKQRLYHFTFPDGLIVGSCFGCGTVLTWNPSVTNLVESEKKTPDNKPWQFNPSTLKWEDRKPTEKGPWQFCSKCDSPDYIEIITRIKDGKSYKTMIDNRKYWIARGGIGRR